MSADNEIDGIAPYLDRLDLLVDTDPLELRDEAMRLALLVDELRDPDDCWYDHHGYCQAHAWMATHPTCPHKRAREILFGQ